MSDYRDDRGALRQRIETLEAELERSQREKAEVEAELGAARLDERQLKPPMLKQAAKGPLLIAVLLALGIGVVVVVGLVSRPSSPRRASPAVRPPPTVAPTANAEPMPSRVDSTTCRCGTTQLAYRANGTMSFGGSMTYFVSVALRGEQEVELTLGPETVPPAKLDGGETQLLLACDATTMVLAFGQRVSAWRLGTGEAAWSTTLPVPVGQGKNGPLRIECTELDVKKDVVAIPHVGGATRLSMKDGALVKTSGAR